MADVRDVEMDDMDLDLTIDPEMAIPDEEPAVSSRASLSEVEADRQQAAEQHDLTVASGGDKPSDEPTEEQKQPAPMKVYIHGVDEFTTEDVKAYSTEHYPAGDFEKIEWIDDSSAKIVYGSVDAVPQALEAFIDQTNPNPRDSPFGPTYVAKRSSNKPYAEIRVRSAVLGDMKKARAHEASRFYLMNPDHDPRMRRGQYDTRRGRQGNAERGEYNRRRFDEREQRRREEGGAFDVSMYDDDAGETNTTGHARSVSDSESHGRRRARRRSTEDLFGSTARGRLDARLRDRSASPLGEGDGRLGFNEDDEQPARRTARRRSTTPPHLRRALEREYNKANLGKELFPNGEAKELFPMKSPKELFPNRSSISIHRRTPAFDAADETPQKKTRSLADRITGGPASGNGKGHEQAVEDDEGFGIRGGAATNFSIRGTASSNAGGVVKELFPLKAGGNAGKELFGEKIKGRGAARRRAEDMF